MAPASLCPVSILLSIRRTELIAYKISALGGYLTEILRYATQGKEHRIVIDFRDKSQNRTAELAGSMRQRAATDINSAMGMSRCSQTVRAPREIHTASLAMHSYRNPLPTGSRDLQGRVGRRLGLLCLQTTCLLVPQAAPQMAPDSRPWYGASRAVQNLRELWPQPIILGKIVTDQRLRLLFLFFRRPLRSPPLPKDSTDPAPEPQTPVRRWGVHHHISA